MYLTQGKDMISPELHTNGYHRHRNSFYLEKDTNKPAIVVLEELARKKQEKVLKKHVSYTPNTNMEVWADHENEGRRLPNDIYSVPSLNIKRSYVEVKRYSALIEEIYKNEEGETILFELIKNWITTTNFDHIATLLDFTSSDVETAIHDMNQNNLLETQNIHKSYSLNKNTKRYSDFLTVISEDDIVPLVMIRTLILEKKGLPTLRDLFAGLQRSLKREMLEIQEIAAQPDNGGVSPKQVANNKILILLEEKEQLYKELLETAKRKERIALRKGSVLV